MRAGTRRLAIVWCVAGLLAAGHARAQQDLGHKTLGTLGLKAGSQPETGIYVTGRLLLYHADEVFDRNGNRIPIALDLDAVASGVGVAVAYRLPGLAAYVNASVGLPVAHVTIDSDRLEAAIDRYGLADLYVQPLRLGWRLPHLDLVTGYAFYVPTGRFEPGPRGGVSRAQWSHEFSAGGTVSFDREKSWTLSVLGSYELNQPKLGIDITRGDTVQLQGGLGKTLFGFLDVGVVGYALWQVRDDRGHALPPLLRGARDQTYGIGAELGVTVREARAQITLRYAHDLGAVARPQGQLLLFSLRFAPWQRALSSRSTERPRQAR